jgi:hypothetical protein
VEWRHQLSVRQDYQTTDELERLADVLGEDHPTLASSRPPHEGPA